MSLPPRLCFLSYRQIREFAAPVIAEYAGRAHIEVIDGAFDGALAIARDLIAQQSVDVFISAGSNASILRRHLQSPVATIHLTGFDLMQALIKARRIATRVGVVMYGQTIPELESIKTLLNITISQHAYQTPEDGRQQFELLRKAGYEVIVGSSLVVELAEQAGLHGLLAYSHDSIRKGFDDALELARIARLEASRYEQLHSVLHNLQEAVLAVDLHDRITAINPAMQQLLAGSGVRLEGQALHTLAPELSLQATLATGQIDQSMALRFAQGDWVAHRTPIREHGEIVGAALTLYGARNIQEADTSLRRLQRRQQRQARHHFSDLVGCSPSLQTTIASARRYAANDMSVLITGESGVGKEVFAQAMHNASQRAGKPFVAVNCASFPESLLESELFGYEEGAFTGSRRGGKSGLIEAAHTGTLFLDEIGDMPLHLQTRLLRILQEREVTRLGATAPIPIDIRVISATHQPLMEMLAEKTFRQDLYYRLNTLRLHIPALRVRREDIAALAELLLTKALGEVGSRLDAPKVIGSLLHSLEAYDWPGNVRELENIANRIAVFLQPHQRLEGVRFSDLQHDCPELFVASAPPESIPGAGTQSERITDALRLANGNLSVAARLLGISRTTLWRWQRAFSVQNAQGQ